MPVVEELLHNGAVVSVDTRKSFVVAGAIQAGAQIINDVSAFTFDGDGLEYVSQTPQTAVILMHSQGTPEHMQDAPSYDGPASLEVLIICRTESRHAKKREFFVTEFVLTPA